MSEAASAPSGSGDSSAHHAPHGSHAALVLGAIGVVFGDIGTSPLYTIQECFHGAHGVRPTADNILGVLSLVFWSLMMVVTVKYLAFVMRADNRGEGGIFALLALVPEKLRVAKGGRIGAVSLLVIAGAALLFGDGIITPAISVLSAMEGLGVATSALAPAVVPVTCVILATLFAIQRLGTGAVGRFFGPVMVLWFSTIAALGAWHAAHNPSVFAALSPVYGARFFANNGWHGFTLLGSVVLAVTGGEALYADMGHFGSRAIRHAWLALILPALVLCYFGQGAYLLAHPEAAAQPFFSMVPRGWPTFALVAIAAPATVIASQALISGVFSLTHQAVQLGYFPRVEVRHTARDAEGQIYIPVINWVLAVSCIILVLVFKQSTKLAAAFGLAVSGTMAITSVVFYVVARNTWGWSVGKALPLLVLFLAFDLPFFAANLLKFFDGGYLPLVVGAVFFAAMAVWRRGRSLLGEHYGERVGDLDAFITALSPGGGGRPYQEGAPSGAVQRIPGVGVFMTSSGKGVPPVLDHIVRRMRSLHSTVVLVTISTDHVPYVTEERLAIEDLGNGFHRVIVRVGFMESPNVPKELERAAQRGVPLDPKTVTYFLGRETFVAGAKGRMGPTAESLFALLSRNARNATLYFSIPTEQVVEVGMQIDL
ncbi:MAG: KUP/HAK/KT family potassium transporter [Myxococcales bacterium]|nr:KUP/HAK/KT family potassium transporter [Myxococcales bacterium]